MGSAQISDKYLDEIEREMNVKKFRSMLNSLWKCIQDYNASMEAVTTLEPHLNETDLDELHQKNKNEAIKKVR